MSQTIRTRDPAARSIKLRLLLFIYGRGNILGCALALLGPTLLFFGLIGPGWVWITAGLYAAGYVLGGIGVPELERHIEDSLTWEQTLEHLDQVIFQASAHLNPDMQRHLSSIRGAVAEVLPRMLNTAGHDSDLYIVRETVLRYLPETLANYVALPPVFRNTHLLKDGKTARQVLGEQLELLDTQMNEVVVNVAGADAQALLANGKFLEMKFRQPDFLLR